MRTMGSLMVHHGHADKDVIRILEKASEKKDSIESIQFFGNMKVIFFRENSRFVS